MLKKILGTIGVLGVAALGLTGCSAEVSADEAAAQAAAALEPQLGFSPEITCPEGLPAEVGATITCELTDPEGNAHDAVLTVTEVDGGDVLFDVVVGE